MTEQTNKTDLTDLSYSMIRQPFRITMAKWNYTAVQKRILTKIISSLQKEISSLEKGINYGQLNLFATSSDTIELTLNLNDLVANSNNYTHVKKALQDLRKTDIEIVLPATKGKKSGIQETETILTGLIERAKIVKFSRSLSITIHKSIALELIKSTSGLTSLAENIIYNTNNSHTQKIYEIISHWKDQEVISFTLEEFKTKLSIENKYKNTTELVRRVIKPAEKELKEIGDVYFVYNPTRSGTKITKINLNIKHRKTIAEDELHLIMLKDSVINMLRQHFGFKPDNFTAIEDLLQQQALIPRIQLKLVELGSYMSDTRKKNPNFFKSIQGFVITSLKNEFSGN